MLKKTEMASSIYLSDKTYTINSTNRSKIKITKPQHVKIEIVNQNLEEAIREVKSHIKENPQWRLSVEATKKQYPTTKEKPILADQSQTIKQESNLLPLSKKESAIEPSDLIKSKLSTMKYTKRLQQEYETRMQQIKERRMQLSVLSLEKQMRAKLQKKIKDNIILKEKAKIISEIQERRTETMRLLDKQHYTQKQEKSLLHQSNLIKVDMLRKCKKRAQKRQLRENSSLSNQSKVQLSFKEFLVNKQKQQKKQVLVTRYRMLRAASQGSIRRQRIEAVKHIKTSNSHKNLEAKGNDLVLQ